MRQSSKSGFPLCKGAWGLVYKPDDDKTLRSMTDSSFLQPCNGQNISAQGTALRLNVKAFLRALHWGHIFITNGASVRL